MEFNVFDVVQHVLNIVVLYIILRAILYNPVRKFMRQREEKLEMKQQETDKALAEARAAAESNEARLEMIQRSTQKLVAEKSEYAEKKAAEIIEEAKNEAARLLEEARRRIAADRERAQNEFVNETADIAVELARRILGREVSKEDNQRLIDDFFKKVG